MSNLLKDIYNEESLRALTETIQAVYPAFQTEGFLKSVMDETWEGLALKERMRKISTSLGKYLPADYSEAIRILDDTAPNCLQGLAGICFPDFVEVYGQDPADWELSIAALARYTPYSTSEFAVRPFIINHEERMMAQMYAWSKHENEHLRRLASEGCRPQLPWGQSLPKYKKDPAPILPILTQLRADPSLYVRKSVANNLNDISKTHPELVAKLAREWYSKDEYTDWIIKHGCRTLLKKGHREVLDIFGYHDAAFIDVTGFRLEAKAISLGGDITFSFQIHTKEATKVRLEYGIDYVKANGKRNRKIFQISELSMKENESKSYTKKHAFEDLTTRKHYPGIHTVTLIINGVERGALDFALNS